jgi:nucleotide-binding universal stress UspA family protein
MAFATAQALRMLPLGVYFAMVKIERILFPTNLSMESDEALRYAIALAGAYDATLLMLHCIDAKQTAQNAYINTDASRSLEQAFMRHSSLPLAHKVTRKPLIIQDVLHVGDTISYQAKLHRADLIVMRSRRRPRAAVLLGSTAEMVSKTAPCPVLITHPNETEWVGLSGEIDLHRILIAHDFSPDSELALRYGCSLAQEYQAELHLLNVTESRGQSEPELAWSSSDAYSFLAGKLQRAFPNEASLWCNIVNSVRTGKPYEQVLDYAKEQKIELICMGASGRDWSLDKLLGSNVDRVLRQAPCPVLVARPTKYASSVPENMTDFSATSYVY